MTRVLDLSIAAHGAGSERAARAQINLAGRDCTRAIGYITQARGRAMDLAREARALFARAPDAEAKPVLPEIDRWLAARSAKTR